MTLRPHQAPDYAAELTREVWARVQANPPTKARPRIAATLIIIDRSGKQPRILMGRRHAGHRFMPGKYVFPGGRVERADLHMPFLGTIDPSIEARLMAGRRGATPRVARAIALASIRETFEETGLLIGSVSGEAADRVPAGPWRDFAARGVLPDLAPIHFVGRAITPPRNALRFDAHFFTVDAGHIAARIDDMVGETSELVELAWVTFEEAKNLGLVAITRVMLQELDHRLTNGMSPDHPVPFYRTGPKGWLRREL